MARFLLPVGESTLLISVDAAHAAAVNGGPRLLARMADKGQLWPDAKINMTCKLAGEKFYADWFGAYGKERRGQVGQTLPQGTIAAQCRKDYRTARAELDPRFRKPVELILLDGEPLLAVGKSVTDYANTSICRSIAIERFTAGLFLLAQHYGFCETEFA